MAAKRTKKDEQQQAKASSVKRDAVESNNNRVANNTKYLVSFSALLAAALAGVTFWYTGPDYEQTLASVSEIIPMNRMKVRCSTDYDEERKLYPGCTPTWCGRVVTDHVVSSVDASRLLEIAKVGFRYGVSGGGASILDLHSGALSKGDRFINIYSMTSDSGEPIFRKRDFEVYTRVKNSIREAIAKEFGIEADKLYLTKPTFFSKMTMRSAQTIHDEYWHMHVDKETYGSFHYTSLLYLSTYRTHFTGGRFTFVDDGGYNVTVEPRTGRLSFFTSGSENKHFVEKLEYGVRYAITVSFTCDASKAIEDPRVPS